MKSIAFATWVLVKVLWFGADYAPADNTMLTPAHPIVVTNQAFATEAACRKAGNKWYKNAVQVGVAGKVALPINAITFSCALEAVGGDVT